MIYIIQCIMKNKNVLLITGVIVIIIVAVLGVNLYRKVDNDNIDGENAGKLNVDDEIDEESLKSKDTVIDISRFDFTNETIINLSEKSIEGEGVSISEDSNGMQTFEITKSGAYRVKGNIENGRIVVSAKDCDVNLILDNATINSLYSAPIYVYKSNATMVTLEDGTINSISDGSEYNFQDEYSSSTDEEPNACLYSKSDLIIYGNGTLNVTANNNNAITSKDTLYIENAYIKVNAKNHGINGKDSNTIKNANINVVTGGDGIRATNDTDSNLGWIRIENSEIKLETGEDGIEAKTDLIIYGGKFDIISGGGYEEISSNNYSLKAAPFVENTSTTTDVSMKGIKASGTLLIEDTTMNISSFDDSIHSNGSIKIASGSYTLKTNDDGIHADNNVTIDNGNIDIQNSYEGIEGNNIIINDGNISIVSTDDGINISYGNDFSGFGNFDKNMMGNKGSMRMPDNLENSEPFDETRLEKMNGKEGFERIKNSGDMKNIDDKNQKERPENIEGMPDYNNSKQFENTNNDMDENENVLIINGGNIVVNALGDGLDSNGSIIMNGGKVIIHGPTNSGNGALDYDKTFEITGGELIAIGASGMSQSPSSNSSQSFIFTNVQNQKEDSEIVLKDLNGNEIVKCNSIKSFSNIVISSPKLEKGEKYELYINSSKIAEVTAGEITSGNKMQGKR